MNLKGKIIITLKSDLCAASGDGFSLSIDTDICTDRYGLPYIPSRRLKGCLREAAEYIGCSSIDSIFGVSGDVSRGSLKVNDARLESYDELCEEAEENNYSSEQILSLFTSVKASTAIENDTAKENSLRFTRVVDRYSPFDHSELRFVSDIEYAQGDEQQLMRVCKALRNIGYKRTRGYGSVKCELIPCEGTKSFSVDIPNDENEYELRYTIKLAAPLMIAGKTSMETLDYIPGTAVLGAMSASYLKTHTADERFEELFLKGSLKFSNLYITKEGVTAEPAPSILGKPKDGSVIDFVGSERAEHKTNRLKALKGGYLIRDRELKPITETIYHHGQKQDENDKLLYTQQCLCEGQMFSGYISGKGSDLFELMPAFEKGSIDIGRSKTAQYSTCQIVAADCVKPNSVQIAAGEIYALMCSDVLLLDENANYAGGIKDAANALGGVLNDDDIAHSVVMHTSVMGFVSVGRFKREHIRAIKKGSVIRLKTDKPMAQYITIGERQNEGFGLIKLCNKDELKQLGREAVQQQQHHEKLTGKLKKLINQNTVDENRISAAIKYAAEKYNMYKSDFNASFVGRLLLMVKQAADEADLDNRIASIKTDKKRKAAQSFKAGISEEYRSDVFEFMRIALTVIKYKNKEG